MRVLGRHYDGPVLHTVTSHQEGFKFRALGFVTVSSHI